MSDVITIRSNASTVVTGNLSEEGIMEGRDREMRRAIEDHFRVYHASTLDLYEVLRRDDPNALVGWLRTMALRHIDSPTENDNDVLNAFDSAIDNLNRTRRRANRENRSVSSNSSLSSSSSIAAGGPRADAVVGLLGGLDGVSNQGEGQPLVGESESEAQQRRKKTVAKKKSRTAKHKAKTQKNNGKGPKPPPSAGGGGGGTALLQA